MASRLQCDFCGAVGYLDRTALRCHQVRNSLCLSKQRAAKRIAENQTNNVEGVAPTSCSIEEQEATTANVIEAGDDDSASLDAYQNWFEQFGEDPFINQKSKEFDVTFQLVFFMRQCQNGGGLSQKDMNRLLRLLHHPLFNAKQIQVRSAADVCKYEGVLKEQRDDLVWEEVEVHQETDSAPAIKLLYRNPLDVLKNLFSSPKNQEGFQLKADSELSFAGERIYTTLQSGDWWRAMQDDVDALCKGAVVAPIILYSDQTSLSHNKRTQGWPLVMTVGNISCNMRGLPEGHALLAVLPVVGGNDLGATNKKASSKAKVEIFHKCEEIILGPLKDASYKGLHLKDSFGVSHWVFPRLCLYICDQPEGSKVTCTFDSNKSNFPCSSCLVPKESLSAVSHSFPYRTEQGMKQIFEHMQQSCYKDTEWLSKDQSVHPVQCAIWGFCSGELAHGNPYQCIQVDGLHQSILGIFKTLIGIIRASLSSTALVVHPMRALDQRLAKIHKHYRYASFRLPGSSHGGYFESNANYHGFEHKSVMQVVVFCLLGVVPSGMISVFVDFIDWYLLAFHSKSHTDRSLDEMNKLMIKSVTSMKRYAKSWQKSAFDLVKIHWMTHVKDCVKRSGLPSEYDTCIYEHMHIGLMKIPFRHSNKRNFKCQIIQHHQRKMMLLDKADLHQSDLQISKEDVTALDRAVNTGENVLSGKDVILRPEWLQGDNNQHKSDFLPAEVNDLLTSQPEVSSHLLPLLMAYMKEEDLQLPVSLQIWKSLAIPVGEGDRFGDWPMYTRACRSFHGRCWYGFVDMQMEALGMDPVTWVGQVRLLLSCEVYDISGSRIHKQLAFVKLLRQLEHDHYWKLLKCEQFTFVDEPLKRFKRKHSRTTFEPYIILDIANITRVVHVVPNFTQDGHFFSIDLNCSLIERLVRLKRDNCDGKQTNGVHAGQDVKSDVAGALDKEDADGETSEIRYFPSYRGFTFRK